VPLPTNKNLVQNHKKSANNQIIAQKEEATPSRKAKKKSNESW
jgi:hypothetical protein